MKIALLAFTQKGLLLANRLKTQLAEMSGISVERCPENGLFHWTKQHFYSCDALIFIGAAGIAVRAIAPLIDKKTKDPAVLVIDECGKFVIPLLSGHIGGANALTEKVATHLRAQAVITTATDCNGLFAVDSWATEQGYAILNPENIKQVSARLLSKGKIRIKSGFKIQIGAQFAEQMSLTDKEPFDVTIGIQPEGTPALHLVPPVLTLGVGCKKGISAQAIQAQFNHLCAEQAIDPHAFNQVCSIDIKANEAGLLEFCNDIGLPLVTFSAEALNAVAGDFTPSEFVRQVTGVDNVCERSAVLSSGGTLLVKKQAHNGVTMAVGLAPHTVRILKLPPEKGN